VPSTFVERVHSPLPSLYGVFFFLFFFFGIRGAIVLVLCEKR
jgi:hypothetical protein